MGGNSGSQEKSEKTSENKKEETQQNNQSSLFESNSNDKCFDYNKRFTECLKYNNGSVNICQSSFDDLSKCQSNMI